MKKLKNNLIIGLLIITPFTFTKAQSYTGSSATPSLFASYSNTRELYNAIEMENKSGVRAMKDLAARFTNASVANWFEGNNVISASVIENGIKNSVLYDKKGRWLRTIKSYDETKMPADIRELVRRSKYFDSDILYVWEVQKWDSLYYVVHLQNKKTVNEIVVYDNEITLLKSYITQ